MLNFNCLIIEDEPIAAEILEDYIAQVPFLHLVEKCDNAISALELLQNEKVDIIFLDIHLPKLKGLDFLKALIEPPQIVITSAYQEYALEGYELNVVDYLLKPIEFNRFIMAVNKLKHPNESELLDNKAAATLERSYLFFNVNKKKVKMFLDEILYIESFKEYIKIVSKAKTILTKFTLGEIEDILNKDNFLRTHRSFIVAKDKIDAFTAADIEINKQQIPIGRSYREQVLACLEDKKQ